MRDAVAPVDLASPEAGGGGQARALWRLDGEDLQANLVRLGVATASSRIDDEVDVLLVVVSGRGELTLGGRVHPLAPMALVHVPKGTVRAMVAVDGPLAYRSTAADRRAFRLTGTPSGGEVPRQRPSRTRPRDRPPL